MKKVIPKQCPSKKNCFEKTHTLYKFLKNHSGKLRYSKTFGILHFWHYLGVNKELKEKRRDGSILMNLYVEKQNQGFQMDDSCYNLQLLRIFF